MEPIPFLDLMAYPTLTDTYSAMLTVEGWYRRKEQQLVYIDLDQIGVSDMTNTLLNRLLYDRVQGAMYAVYGGRVYRPVECDTIWSRHSTIGHIRFGQYLEPIFESMVEEQVQTCQIQINALEWRILRWFTEVLTEHWHSGELSNFHDGCIDRWIDFMAGAETQVNSQLLAEP